MSRPLTIKQREALLSLTAAECEVRRARKRKKRARHGDKMLALQATARAQAEQSVGGNALGVTAVLIGLRSREQRGPSRNSNRHQRPSRRAAAPADER